MADQISDLVDSVQESLRSLWDAAIPDDLPNLSSLPAKVHHSLDDLFDKLTNNRTLPLPNPADWLPSASTTPPPPPPPPAPSTRTPRWLQLLADHTARHPVLYTAAALGLSTSGAYYLFPAQTARTFAPLTRFVPLALLPDPKNRPLRLLPHSHGVAAEIRKEAVLVLGADSPAGRELALDLERRGFVVVATVRDPNEVDALEKTSRGWIKVLVLDPSESSSVAPFLRSLSTALSLRFPLHTSGDPFSRPSHALALTGLVNCLALSSSADIETLCPVEAVESEALRKAVGERVATLVGVVKGVMPFLRAAAGRPGAPEGVFLSLVPSATANQSLPFLSLASASNAAVLSLLHSFRRELSLSTTSNLRASILEVGFFDVAYPASSSPAPLPIRLNSLYAPALARRAPPADENVRVTAKGGRQGTSIRKLNKRVWQILVRPTHARAVERIGAGSTTYHLLTYLPHSLLDAFLVVQDRLYAFYLSHLASSRFFRLSLPSLSSATSSSRLGASSSRTARPLPTTPPPPAHHHHHPDALRPAAASAGPSQVPLREADSFGPSSIRGYDGEAEAEDGTETESQSSLEDLGVGLGVGAGLGSGAGSVYGTGSFVEVPREGEGA
ncbi:hypothetical protein JCM5296_000188 [Sporobolomyces johnsonii]